MLELEEEKIRKESIEISVITDRDETQRQFPRPSFIFNDNLGTYAKKNRDRTWSAVEMGEIGQWYYMYQGFMFP